MNDLIKEDMTIGEVIQKYPSTVEVLLAAGIHCVGCHGSYHETIGQGFRGHGMSDEEIQDIVSDMNTVAEQDIARSDALLTITETAATKLKGILKAEDKEHAGLRVEVVKGGRSGSEYALEVVENKKKDDIVLKQHGVKLFVSQRDKDVIKGSTIDFVDALQDGGFRITNPNKHNRACGKSFS